MRILNDFVILFRRHAESIHAAEKIFSTKASDAGAETKSFAKGASSG
jgi:hypothetical protein